MKNKVNKIYSLFTENVVLSKSTFINAVEGYDINSTIEVASLDDAIKNFCSIDKNMSSVSHDELMLYVNPVTGSELYIGNLFIAYKTNSEEFPKIKVVCNGSDVIADDLKFLLKVSPLLKTNFNYKIMMVYNIGCLSYPNHPFLNEIYNLRGVKFKLPIML